MILLKTPSKAIFRVVLTLCLSQTSFASTTTLTFDEFSDQTPITTQYEAQGVTASGANAVVAFFTPWPANTGSYLAYAPNGVMTYNLNASIIGNVQSISAFISGTTSVGIYAYDSAGALVGLNTTAGPSDNALITVATNGNPISTVTIHNGGASFAIDTLKFESFDEAPTCNDVLRKLYSEVRDLAESEFKNNPESRRTNILKDITKIYEMMQEKKKPKDLQTKVKNLVKAVNEGIKPSEEKNEILEFLRTLGTLIDQKKC